jgi:hypothetical protein
VTFSASYLTSLGVGTTDLTFNFSAGLPATLALTVENTDPVTVVTYAVTYVSDGNPGSVPTGVHAYAQGDTVTVAGNTGGLSRANCTFSGWNTAQNGSGIPYAAGNVFSITCPVTLHPQWTADNAVTIAPPVFTPGGGNVTASQMVSIADPNYPSATDSVQDAVYYSLQGVNPALDPLQSTIYTGQFPLDQSSEVSAAVYSRVYGWSQPASVTLTFAIPATSYQVINTSVSAPPTTISFGSSGSVNLDADLPSGGRTIPLPPLVIQSNTSGAGSVVVSVYAGTTIGGTGWNGSLNAPTSVGSVTVTPVSGETPTVESVIEIGSIDTPLTFNQPVRILFSRQTGKLVGFYQNNAFTAITTQMSADSASALPEGVLDGYYDNGTDLIVWTTHFTQYVIYTEAQDSAAQVAGAITSVTAPSAGATSLTMPTVPNGFTIAITSSSDQSVIALDGTITPPATTTVVYLVFTVTRTSDGTTATVGPLAVTVPAEPSGNTGGGGGGGGGAAATLAISTASLNPATVGVSYSATISTNGDGTAPYTFSVISGNLPDGLTLASTGSLSGTPTTAGQYSFSIEVKDVSGNTASLGYVLTVNAATTTGQPTTALTATLSDITGNWAQADIEQLVSLGYITGYPDGTFKPGNQITRAEFCTIMDKALNLTTYPQQTPTFTDVNTGAWYDQAVETAVYAGIAKGYGDGSFKPNAPISRQEMACVLVQALGKSQLADASAKTATKFIDDSQIARWSRGYVTVALQQDIVSGYPDGSFKPESDTTRAEACAMISNFLNAYK